METIDPSTSLFALVAENPHLARRFDLLGVDISRRGRWSLAETCEALGVEPDVLVGPPVPAVDDRTRSLTDPVGLVDHIEIWHLPRTLAELPRLTALSEELSAAHGDRHPELFDLQAAVGELRGDLEAHLASEDEDLFPRIRHAARAGWDIGAADRVRLLLDTLSAQHGVLTTTVAALRTDVRRLSERPVADAASALRDGLDALDAGLAAHVHDEDELLFPLVRRRLASAAG